MSLRIYTAEDMLSFCRDCPREPITMYCQVVHYILDWARPFQDLLDDHRIRAEIHDALDHVLSREIPSWNAIPVRAAVMLLERSRAWPLLLGLIRHKYGLPGGRFSKPELVDIEVELREMFLPIESALTKEESRDSGNISTKT